MPALNTAILLITCPDRRGIVAEISAFLYRHGANILHNDQHQENSLGLFFTRIEWDLEGFDLDPAAFEGQFEPIAAQFKMDWRLEYTAEPMRMAVFVSRETHCLLDLLHKRQGGELRCEIPLIISNHPGACELAAFYGVHFELTPVTPETKRECESHQLDLLAQHGIDLIVLARYMQVLSPNFIARYPLRIINVHHSFLPAFSGARPYHAAYQRGVKLIGATSHYATDVLDDGPIIEQDVTRISHRDQVEDLIQKGRDLERVVLSRAVRWHLEHRVVCFGNKTVVFD